MLAPSTGGATTPPGTRQAPAAYDTPLLAHTPPACTPGRHSLAYARLMRGAFDTPRRVAYALDTPRRAAYMPPTHTQGGDPGILHPPKVKVKDPKSETDNPLDPSTTTY